MSDIKDGGPAFPLGANEYAGHGPCWGMTLRDYFAAKALIGLMSEPFAEGYPSTAWHLTKDENLVDTYAMSAYKIADAMLSARGQS